MDVNDPSNWALITGSFAAPVLGASPPFQWDSFGAVGEGDPPNTYYFSPSPNMDNGVENFVGVTYIGPDLVGTFQINWKEYDAGYGAVIAVANGAGTLATLSLPRPPILDYGGNNTAATSGVLGIPITSSAGLKIGYLADFSLLPPHEYYFMVAGLTFSFVPGSGTGPVTGGDGPPPVANATGFGRHIWRPRDNAVC